MIVVPRNGILFNVLSMCKLNKMRLNDSAMLTNSLYRFINEETFLYHFLNDAQYLQTDLLPFYHICFSL